MYLQKVIIFVGVLKIKDEKKISRIWIHWSEARIHGSGSDQKVSRIYIQQCYIDVFETLLNFRLFQ
jgi:hypothetical protein